MTVTITVPFDKAALEALRAKFPEYIDKALRAATQRIQRMMRQYTPVSKRPWEKVPGTLKRTAYASHSFNQVTMTWPQKYAKWLVEGTGAHWVRPTKGPLLKWQPAPGVWGKSPGHEIAGIRPLTLPVDQILQEAAIILEEELLTLALLELQTTTPSAPSGPRGAVAWRPPTGGGGF